jgi:GAF domain-containing protein
LVLDGDLNQAHERIAALEAEVARLNGLIVDRQSIDLLRSQLTRAAALPKLRAQQQDSKPVDQVVATAMAALRARAGSLYVVDGQDLVFESALGSHAGDLAGRRIPGDRGIAGWVAATGQAIAVADVQQDPRWARDIAQGIGYAPTSMAVAPLLADGGVIGVLQLLDRDDGRPFDNADLEMLGLFAQQAAVTLEQSRELSSISLLLRRALRDLVGPSSDVAAEQAVDDLGIRLQSQPEFQQTLEIADLLARISQADDGARRLCLEIAAAFASYLQRRSGFAAGSGY